ncbi:hypothetical protein YB2330_000641 [Saitoella coloradoensis]
MAPKPDIEILDIRSPTSLAPSSLRSSILDGLNAPGGQKTLPTLILYDERGLQLFEDITYLDEYYLTASEIDVLKREAGGIAARIKEGSVIVELGSGCLRKTQLILTALEAAKKKCTYYALDLSRSELERSLTPLPSFTYVTARGLHGTYDDGRAWLSKLSKDTPKMVLWLGSSAGNMDREESAQFLRTFVEEALNVGDQLLIGIDRRNNPETVWRAYNDSRGVTREFELNGLRNANGILESEVFNLDRWEYVGEYDEKAGAHLAYFVPSTNVHIEGILVKEGEKVRVEKSVKFNVREAEELFDTAGIARTESYGCSRDLYDLHLLHVPPFHTPLLGSKEPVPTTQDWSDLWSTWDTVTLQMIPQKMLLTKPIDLRHPCIFYIGHIPTFLDIHLTRAKLGGDAYINAAYTTIFERGIDPDVDDPTQCHAHSEVPDSWPDLHELLEFRDKVRARVKSCYGLNGLVSSALDHVGRRALWLAFEHEAMHLETLLYMLLQSPQTVPPPGVPVPDWKLLASASQRPTAAKEDDKWIMVESRKINVGLNDPEGAENGGTDGRLMGWDNEKPQREWTVDGFIASKRPITNGEYAAFLQESGSTEIPESWSRVDGVYKVKTVFGFVAMEHAQDWPVIGSYDEIAAYAKYAGGRLPREEELRVLYDLIADSSATPGTLIAGVNGHLTSNGVHTTPPAGPNFVDLSGANVGFKHWHPTPAHGTQLVGSGGVGAWEWTSTPMAPHEGFLPSKVYPGYTADFFDGKHNVVLGGSWATHGRLAGRRTFRNWYQRNYGFAWVTGRVIKDIDIN